MPLTRRNTLVSIRWHHFPFLLLAIDKKYWRAVAHSSFGSGPATIDKSTRPGFSCIAVIVIAWCCTAIPVASNIGVAVHEQLLYAGPPSERQGATAVNQCPGSMLQLGVDLCQTNGLCCLPLGPHIKHSHKEFLAPCQSGNILVGLSCRVLVGRTLGGR